MAVSEFVSITIAVNNAGVAQLGFGTPAYLSYDATFPEEFREYNQYSDVLSDFAAGTATANVANAIFAQSPHPQTLIIGKGTNKPTLEYEIGAIVVNNSYAYKIQVDGPGITSTLATYTSGGSATLPQIHNGLITQLNAVVGKNYTAAFSPLASLTGQSFVVASQAQGELTITAHGLNTGDGPVQLTTTGALPTGLSTATNYWVIKVDANTIQLATSLANALAGTFIVLSSNGTGTNTETPQAGALSPTLPFLVTGSAAGNWFSLECQGNSAILSNKMVHADPGVATDLNALALASSDWYWLVTAYNSKAYVDAAAAWVETQTKAYIVSVCDSDSVNTASGNMDCLDTLNGLSYKRTCGKYHTSPLECFDAASTGRIAPLNPGAWTEAFKTLVGVEPLTLTATQRTNLRSRNSGAYTSEKGREITWDGKVFNTVYGYLDITVAIDWFSDQVVSAAFGVLVSMDKVAYTDEDIDMIAGAVRGVIRQATSDANPVLDPGDPTGSDPTNPPPSITFPTVASISPATRALRQLPNGNINGRLQGAIQNIAFQATLTF
jgi:Protein of unknown function (DUF3383)